ncbi:HEPN domain-containing protein [Pantoea dispersa]|uniref:HEPN domain-containing protein n=1 Tax=Pantoea dispersa TaxID=59814 RepID=UPI00123A1B1C|nr:HEPN domain-containing protein [Pantoea dispersa]KAA8670323.1 hypothetical protein F4W08_14230 [Pantoea dispersa]
MKVEYLVTIELKNSFCKTKKSFLNFLQSDSDISLSGKKAKYIGNEFDIEVVEENTPSEKYKIFHLKLASSSDDLELFSAFLRVIRGLLNLASNNNIQTLWDDVSYSYSRKAYPIIHELENLMRKLITKFMLTNVGLGWSETAIPDELKKIRRDKKQQSSNNYLYDADFIQLSTFLFDSYRTQDLDGLIRKIKDHDGDSIPIDDVRDFIPKSNWQRYFQKHVDCEESLLKSRWDKLYLIRCKVAHNNFFERNDFDMLIQMSSEIKPIIEGAISSLEKITVPEEEREELAENAAVSTNYRVGEFLLNWRALEKKIGDLAVKAGMPKERSYLNIKPTARELRERQLIGESIYESIVNLSQVRNVIVHSQGFELNEYDLEYYIQNLKSVINNI